MPFEGGPYGGDPTLFGGDYVPPYGPGWAIDLSGGGLGRYARPAQPSTLGGANPQIDLNQAHGDYGAVIPLSMGHRRLSSQIIWATPITGDATSGFFANFAVCWGFNGDTDPSATEFVKLYANGSKIWAGGTKLMPGGWGVTLYKGTETQTADATIVAAGGAQTGYRGLLYGVFTNFPITQAWKFSIPGISAEVSGAVEDSDGASLPNGLSLRAFVERVGSYAGLVPADDIHFDPAISDTITGGVIATEVEFTEFEQNLGKWFGFDTFEGEEIEFIRPVSGTTFAIDLTIPPTHLLNDGDRSITTTRGEDDSPVVLQGRYIDQTQQFRFNTQRARRILFPTRSSESRRHSGIIVPVVMSANQAVTYLGQAIYRAAGQNVLHEFNLPPRYIGIEPGDILSITAGDTVYVVKVQKMEILADLSVSLEAINLFTDEDIVLDSESGTPLGEYGAGSGGDGGVEYGDGTITVPHPTDDGDFAVARDELDVTWITTPADMGTVTGLSIPVLATVAGVALKGVIYLKSTGALVATSSEVTTTGAESSLEFTFSQALDPSTEYGFGVHAALAGVTFYYTEPAGVTYTYAGLDYDSGPADPISNGTAPVDGTGGFAFTVTYTP